jgi:hypothetical protein
MSLFSVGDTSPDFTATLSTTLNSVTTPANLTGATIEIRFTKPSGAVLSKVGTIVAPLLGTVAAAWVTGDLNEAQSWAWEVRVTFAGGRIQTFIGASQFLVSPQAA